jgi:hypothetical protein
MISLISKDLEKTEVNISNQQQVEQWSEWNEIKFSFSVFVI